MGGGLAASAIAFGAARALTGITPPALARRCSGPVRSRPLNAVDCDFSQPLWVGFARRRSDP
jgi:hypothetical protein